MDRFFDRLGDLLQSLLGGGSAGDGYDPRDPDMQAAIRELDAYLEGGAGPFARETPGNGAREQSDSRPEAAIDESLRQDYATLEVSLGASLEQVRRSYKRLLHKYHPDRFSGDAEKQHLATEVTQRLNLAFKRIERHFREQPDR